MTCIYIIRIEGPAKRLHCLFARRLEDQLSCPPKVIGELASPQKRFTTQMVPNFSLPSIIRTDSILGDEVDRLLRYLGLVDVLNYSPDQRRMYLQFFLGIPFVE